MSIAKSRAMAAAALATGLGACASQGDLKSAEIDNAIETAQANTLPATAEEIAAAERADPLTRANFWSKEYEKNPAKADNAIAFGAALREIKSHQRAIDILSQTLVLHPENDKLLLLLGQSLTSMGRNEEAVDVLLKATLANPMNADAYAARGLALDRQERHRDAQRSYMRALSIDPSRIETRSNFAMSLTLTGELTGAEAALRQALADTNGENLQIRENLALVLGLQGKFDEMKALKAHNAPRDAARGNEALLRGMVGSETSTSEPALPEPALSPDISFEFIEETSAEAEAAESPAAKPEIEEKPSRAAIARTEAPTLLELRGYSLLRPS